MKDVLAAAGRRFIHVELAAIIVFAIGIVNAADESTRAALYAGLIVATVAALIAALKQVAPVLSWSALLPADASPWEKTVAAWADAFTQAFIGSFVATITGWLAAPDLSTWHTILVGALIGAFTAAMRALEGLLTNGELPAPRLGFGSAKR